VNNLILLRKLWRGVAWAEDFVPTIALSLQPKLARVSFPTVSGQRYDLKSKPQAKSPGPRFGALVPLERCVSSPEHFSGFVRQMGIQPYRSHCYSHGMHSPVRCIYLLRHSYIQVKSCGCGFATLRSLRSSVLEPSRSFPSQDAATAVKTIHRRPLQPRS